MYTCHKCISAHANFGDPWLETVDPGYIGNFLGSLLQGVLIAARSVESLVGFESFDELG